MNGPSAHTNLLLAIDPIVQVWMTRDTPCGDPLGEEHNLHTLRLSEAVRDVGWDAAFALPETQRLLAHIGATA